MSTLSKNSWTFVSYFKTYWFPKMERWMKKFRLYDHANQNTNGAVERWHHNLKMHLRTEKATKNGRSLIWLLGMLSDDLEHFYWCMLALKFQGAIRNKVKETYVFASIHKARLIADENITYLLPGDDGGKRAEVRTCKEGGEEKVHFLQNYDKDHASCTCGHSEQGITCKHQLKLLLLDGYTEMQLFNLLGTKWGTCCGGLETEYEVVAGEDIDGEVIVEHAAVEEADISFPLKTFTSLAVEDPADSLEESDEPYQSFSRDYYVGLVNSGYSILEKLGSGIKNQALVKLRAWLEWIKTEEAFSCADSVEDFPQIGFDRLEGSTYSLKRKKDCIEVFWDKKQKGTRGKEKADSEKGVEKKEEDIVSMGDVQHGNGWQKIEMKAKKKGLEKFGDGNEDPITVTATPLPFLQKKQKKESHQQYLDRLARESLNLNDYPMDYEAPTEADLPPQQTADVLPSQDIVVTKAGMKGTAGSQLKKQTAGGKKMVEKTAPKKRGRPLGSKNKAKTITVTSSLPANLHLSTTTTREALAPLPPNVEACINAEYIENIT